MELGDVGLAVVQQLWNNVAFAANELVSETKDVMFEKESFKEFSRQIAQLSVIFEALHAKRVDSVICSESTRGSLEVLQSQLNRACKIIRDYKSGSKMRFMFNSHSVLKQMQELAREIAGTISLLELANINTTLYLKAETDKIIDSLRSIEFSSTATTEVIASEITKSMANHAINRDHANTLLHKIAEASGTSVNASLVQEELILLKQEKEEMEAQKKQAEALELSQLIDLLYNSDMVLRPAEEEELATYQQNSAEEELTTYHQNAIDSFTCPLCHEFMTDPVATVCGHSFERKAIQEHFEQGATSCPICQHELPSLELTPNLSLQGSIEEWKRIDLEMKFQTALSGITSIDQDTCSKSLENLQALMELPRYKAIVSERGLIPKMVEFLQHDDKTTTPAALKCCYHLACHSEDNQEIMVEAGAVRYIVKCIYKGEGDTEAIAILLELSTKEALAERIGNTKDCIPILVSMLNNSNADLVERIKKVLENLSSTTHFVIKMAEAGYFQPFIFRFNQGNFEIRASMAAALLNIQIGDNNIESFREKQFICKLVEVLSSSAPAHKITCLKCMKKLLLYSEMSKWFLEDRTTIPYLIGLISCISAETHLKLETTEVLTFLIENIQVSDTPRYLDLQEFVSLLMSLVNTSEPQLKTKFLQLLIVITHKFEIAQNLVRSNTDAVANLFGSLHSDQPEVRQKVMTLIYSVSEKHPAGVPLPPEPAKEHVINALVAILSSSADNKERSTAAGIISYLPSNDDIIDEILLRKSQVLRIIQAVLSTVDDGDSEIRASINPEESLLENALAILLRYTQPTKPKFQKHVRELELYPSLVRILSKGSSLATEYAAIALAHLSQSNASTDEAQIISKQSNISNPLLRLHRFFCFSATIQNERMCSLHGSSCSSRQTLCLVWAGAVRPLVQILYDTQSGAAEAALTALGTMLNDKRTVAQAANIIKVNEGVTAILEVLERGSVSAKHKALDLFHDICKHTELTTTHSQRAERILIHLLAEDALKKRTALVLREMNLLPEQSSYF